ncbi:hypothetical protein [Hydrogenophaga sp.]|uniref:hypothetical protein n=1 Tax=Hydrogenophaga sp. TaxID=1904254 RepID=UPI002AC9A7CA|nr:hypothetical protein [Hydrogenophaga sp.]
MVSLLMVVLTGLGVLALTAAGLHAMRGTQEQQLTVHTNTQAVARAWAGAELVQQYLNSLTTAEVEAIPNGALTLTGVQGVEAQVTNNIDAGSGVRQLVVNVVGRSVQTAVVVQLVYEITPPSAGAPAPSVSSIGTVDINSNLDLKGSIRVLGGTNANLMVKGTVDLGGSVEGINRVCSTEDMSITAAISVNRVCTLGNLTMGGSASVTGDAEVKGNVSMSGNTSITTVLANGNVVLSGGSAGTVSTKGNITVSGGSARITGTAATEGNINWTSSTAASTLNANGNIAYSAGNNNTALNARGNISLSGNGRVQTLNALGNTTLSSNSNTNGVMGNLRVGGNLVFDKDQVVNDGEVRGTLSREPNGASAKVKQDVTRNTSLVVDVPVVSVPVVNPVFKPSVPVDVFLLKETANYVFEIEVGTGKRMVTVRNVDGIVSGTYYLGDYSYKWDQPELARGNKDYLCEAVNDSGICTEPTLPYRTLCQGSSQYNGCFSYNAGTTKWTLNGQSMAPGVAWFDGNLNVSNGTYINTFLATGNIETSGSLKIFSPNYAGYTPVCTDSRSASPYGITVDFRLSGLKPSDLCQADGTYLPNAIGNTALMAGGVNASGMYVGGDISLGASNAIYGNVIAGNILDTTGNTTVVGSVQVANLRSSAGTTTTWRGSTTIDLRNIPSTFTPGLLPCMGGTCTTSGNATGSAGTRIRWSRFL